MAIDYWIENAGSFIHQIFMIVMGGLYALAYLFDVSYKAMNIYMYFIVYPLSFSAFLLSGWKRLLFIPTSLLFFLIPNFETLSVEFFDLCVVFLNDSAANFGSDYIRMSVYLCVVVPILLYLPFILLRYKFRGIAYTLTGLTVTSALYLVVVYPRFEPLLNTYFG